MEADKRQNRGLELAATRAIHRNGTGWLIPSHTVDATTYLVVGYLSRDFLAAILRGFHAAGQAVEAVVVLALVAYAIYRVVQYRKHRMYRVVPRVQVQELAARLASEDAGKLQIVDVRSHGYYDSGGARIKGSIRIEPNNLEEELKHLSKDKDIYLYCT